MAHPLPPDLIPGSSPNWEITPQPAQVGNPAHSGYNHMPPCRWLTVPWQTYEDEIIIGVLCFHGSALDNLPPDDETGTCGITHVEFIANDGAVATVYQPTPHPTRGWWGWWANLKAIPLDHSPVEVRAIAYPYSGIPRVLQGNYRTSGTPPDSNESLIMWSNADGTYTNPHSPVYVDAVNGNDTTGDGTELNPWATVRKPWTDIADCNNLKIILAPGTYNLPQDGGTLTALSRWCQLTCDPSVNREDVIIKNGDTILPDFSITRVRLVRFTDITLDRSEFGSQAPLKGSSNRSKVHVWKEGVEFFADGTGSLSDVQKVGANAAVSANHVTDSDRYRAYVHDIRIVMQPYFMIGMDVRRFQGDMANRPLVRGCTWGNTGTDASGVHPDFAQTKGVPPNAIWCDNLAFDTNAQLIFQHDARNNREYAFINNALDNNRDNKGGFIGANWGSLYWFNTIPRQRQKFVMNSQELKYYVGPYETRTPGTYGVEKSTGSSLFGNIWAINFSDNSVKDDGFALPISPITQETFTDLVDWRFDHNFYSGNHPWKPGTNMSTGFVFFRDRDGGDFYVVDPVEITEGSVPAIVPWDRLQRQRHPLTRHGAVESDLAVELVTRTPRAVPEARSYELPRYVQLRSNSSSTIRYTLDGTDPTESSTLYTGSILISNTTTLKAKAWKDGLDPSPIATHEFEIRNDGVPDPPVNVLAIPYQE